MSPQANGSVQELMARAPLAHKRLRSHNFGDLYTVDSSVGKPMLIIMARLWNEIVYNQTAIFMLGLPEMSNRAVLNQIDGHRARI